MSGWQQEALQLHECGWSIRRVAANVRKAESEVREIVGGGALITGNRRAPLRERKMDLYETPPVATQALLRHEHIPDYIWECCCGPGAIVGVLRQCGRTVVATDLVDYGCSDSEHGIDFLMERSAPPLTQAIVTNPPFRLAGEFVEHALSLAPKVIMLCRLAFLESEKRSSILDGGILARVHIFKNRLPMMHRHGWEGAKTGSAMAFAWFVWSRDHRGPATINRISWVPEQRLRKIPEAAE